MKYYFALLVALLSHFAHAQEQGSILFDSLLKCLPAAKEDTNKINILDKLAYANYNTNPDAGLKYGFQALMLSQKLGWQKGVAISYLDIAVNYEAKSDHTKALDYNQKALSIYEKLGNENGIAATMANIALIYSAQSNYPKALEYNFKALKIYEEPGYQVNKAITLENIGSLYFEQKEYQKTKKYYTEALQNYKAAGDKEGMARNLGNVGIVQDAIGNYTEALQNHMMALSVHKELGNKNYIQINLANIGYVYNHLKNYDKALEYQLMALKMSEDIGSKNSIAINLGNIGETYFSKATDTTGPVLPDNIVQHNKIITLRHAITYLEKAILICREINFAGPLVEFSQYLADAYFLSADYKNAFENLKRHTAIKDSVFSAENKLLLANMASQREIALQEKDIMLKEKQLRIKDLESIQEKNRRSLYILSIALMTIVVCVAMRLLYIYRKSNSSLRREKMKHLSVIEEQVGHIKIQADTLKKIAHMQAHDVRGPVATILGLVQLFNHDDATDPTNKVVVDAIASVTEKLDTAVREIIIKENELDD